MNIKTIYDIGAHIGEDTEFYLEKGFNVIAVEANPELCSGLKTRFKKWSKSGQLTILNLALVDNDNDSVTLHINTEKDDWTSLDYETSSKGKYAVKSVEVPATNLKNLINKYGVPYYLKCDIEMYDINIARDLLNTTFRPDYLSFEIHEREIASILHQAGYKSFQLRNQLFNGHIKLETTNEAKYFWPKYMGGFHSGPFGKDLPEKLWTGIDEFLEIYDAYQKLLELDYIKFSWFDIHARLSDERSFS